MFSGRGVFVAEQDNQRGAVSSGGSPSSTSAHSVSGLPTTMPAGGPMRNPGPRGFFRERSSH
jgi:hypothetical protein